MHNPLSCLPAQHSFEGEHHIFRWELQNEAVETLDSRGVVFRTNFEHVFKKTWWQQNCCEFFTCCCA